MRIGTSIWTSALLAVTTPALACESCEHPEQDVVMTRNVRRMQPDAQNTTLLPRGPLAWGQLNFLHTTDTHGCKDFSHLYPDHQTLQYID
jgi:2',3'-cyclic-nucleotide 2'-phosphodiesterase (5'-nucleotidase family)